MAHAYPGDLAQFVHDRLMEEGVDQDLATLNHVLSAAYQASLLRDEERPLTFRLLLLAPEELPDDPASPDGHHRLRFERPRKLHEQELRRLAPAAKMHRAMMGVAGLRIWGLVHTGPGWLGAMQGRRGGSAPMSEALSVSVIAPGRVLVSRGDVTIAKLAGGQITGKAADVFDSKWLPRVFAEVRREVSDVQIDRDLLRMLGQDFVSRIITTMRLARHGGAILILPNEAADRVVETNRPIAMKYRFVDEEPRRRYGTLVRRAVDALAMDGATWQSYAASTAPEILAVDDGLSDLAHTIAGLADVDGAVVMSKRLEVVGFGGEIVGDLPDVPIVMRASDLEGEVREEEATDGVGTRHRSVYRLCAAIHDALGIVVSQDGGVRLVAVKDGAVTYWDQLGVGPMDI
jgi:hypothetical protein